MCKLGASIRVSGGSLTLQLKTPLAWGVTEKRGVAEGGGQGRRKQNTAQLMTALGTASEQTLGGDVPQGEGLAQGRAATPLPWKLALQK